MFRRRPAPTTNPLWLVVGLGNPGAEYRGTRHNIGFEVLDRLAERHRIRLDRGRSRALVGLGDLDGTPVALVKPLTYMNLSGQAVAPLAKTYGIAPDRVLVVADDKDLPVAALRLRLQGSAGGHNGHKSLIASLGTQDYPRLKVGVGGSEPGRTVEHVLGSFTREERERMGPCVDVAAKTCEEMIRGGYESALRILEAYRPG